MSQLYGGFALLIGYFSFALACVALLPDLHGYFDVGITCDAAMMGLERCAGEAQWIALQSIVASCMVGFIFAALTWRTCTGPGREPDNAVFLAAPAPLFLLLVALTIVLVLHNVLDPLVRIAGVRISEREAPLVSGENLIWPLLLQFIVWARGWRWKLLLAAFLVSIVAVSPFRNVAFTALYFGALVPAWVAMRQARFSQRHKIMVIVAISLTVAVLVFYQTSNRLAQSDGERDGVVADSISSVGHLLTSRAIVPLFQAALVGQMAPGGDLPGVGVTVLKKLHLTSGHNLNEFVYAMLYSEGHIGQATSLLHGEAAANSSLPAFYWVFSAQLLLVLIYLLSRSHMDMGTLVAVALWRGSMGGFFDIVPALALQMGFCFVVLWWYRFRSPV